jgi:hypothetical protein
MCFFLKRARGSLLSKNARADVYKLAEIGALICSNFIAEIFLKKKRNIGQKSCLVFINKINLSKIV